VNARARRLGRLLVVVLAYGVLAAVVAAPVAAQQAVSSVRFEDRLGTLPVEVSLAHNGVSTLDTGVLGRLYWARTGTAGFGATLRAVGPPEAGGTLASYVSPRFVRANAQFFDRPDEVAEAYGAELRSQLWSEFLWRTLGAFLVGGLLLAALFRARSPFAYASVERRRRPAITVLVVVGAIGLTSSLALLRFRNWDGDADVGTTYQMPGIDQLSFSSPQALEVARQVRPFIEKNTERIRREAQEYEEAVEVSARTELPRHIAALRPRQGERIVIAEADPQGSRVGTRVRRTLYSLLEQHLGDDTVAFRTISGDVSSNGTVAEKGFIRGEAHAGGDVPTVAVAGDHDTDTTVAQLTDADALIPDRETIDVAGLRVTGANDPAFKTLFGGLVNNETGVTETELGAALREETDPEDAVIALLHQPLSAAAYLGLDDLAALASLEGRETRPWDDGIPDVPPGAVNVGHLHDADGPWVIWNTDGELVTWTVVSQLGTSGGVEESPTFNRFSTPFSVPLKTVSLQLQYFNTESGLQTGYASTEVAPTGEITITDRLDLGLPGGHPVPRDDVVLTELEAQR
jgi:hypothetical protein